jgi:DNA-binding response OmpR family regulator
MNSLRILVVEDHDESRLALSRLLRMSGHEAVPAANAHEARALAASAMFDVLLIDLALPDGSGTDLLRDLRQSSNAPALALTALGEEWFAGTGANAGFSGWLVKPMVFEDLMSAVEAAAGRSAPSQYAASSSSSLSHRV